MTFAQLINKVLTKLREDTIASSVPPGYPTLVAQIVNEAKEDIENVGPWYGLRTTVDIVTTPGVDQLSLAAYNDRSYLLMDNNEPQAYITTTNYWRRLTLISQSEMNAMRIFSPSTPNNTPQWISFDYPSTGIVATLFPAPNSAYNVRLVLVVPQSDLVNATDALLIPGLPVWREAVVRCMEERGEEFAGPLDGERQRAARALNDAMLTDFGADSQTFEAE